jgi:hypothetical protein
MLSYVHELEEWTLLKYHTNLEKRLDQKELTLEGNTHAQEINVSQLPV